MANGSKSKAQFNSDNGGFFVSHFMRKFDTMDPENDVILEVDKNVLASI